MGRLDDDLNNLLGPEGMDALIGGPLPEPMRGRRIMGLLPSTSSLRAEWERLQAVVAAVEGKLAAAPAVRTTLQNLMHIAQQQELRDARKQLATVEMSLAQTAERDAVQATRPLGCWCLGAGGRGRYMVGDEGGIHWTEFCSCPEAQAQRNAWERVCAREQAWQDAADADVARAVAAKDLHRRLADARIPARLAGCGLDTYPHAGRMPRTMAALMEFTSPETFPTEGGVRRGPSLWLTGPSSRGKSGCAAGALRDWIRAGGSGRFVTIPLWLRDLKATFDLSDPETVARRQALLKAPLHPGLVVIDDLGAERATGWVLDEVLGIIFHRHQERLLTIFTSNLTMRETASKLAGATAPGAVDEAQDNANRLFERMVEMTAVPPGGIYDFSRVPSLRVKSE